MAAGLVDMGSGMMLGIKTVDMAVVCRGDVNLGLLVMKARQIAEEAKI